jgi:hypothetical protein
MIGTFGEINLLKNKLTIQGVDFLIFKNLGFISIYLQIQITDTYV